MSRAAKALTARQAMQAWKEAAEKWWRLRSDSTLAAVLAARAAWYRTVYGEVPPVAPEASGVQDAALEERTLAPRIQLGDRVRIVAQARPAYPAIYGDCAGIVTGERTTARADVRECLVDYLPTGGAGRIYVRDVYLEREAAPGPTLPASRASSEAVPEQPSRKRRAPRIEGALGIGDRVECVTHRSYTDGGGEIIGLEVDAKGRDRYRVRWAGGISTPELKSRIRRVRAESDAAL